MRYIIICLTFLNISLFAHSNEVLSKSDTIKVDSTFKTPISFLWELLGNNSITALNYQQVIYQSKTNYSLAIQLSGKNCNCFDIFSLYEPASFTKGNNINCFFSGFENYHAYRYKIGLINQISTVNKKFSFGLGAGLESMNYWKFYTEYYDGFPYKKTFNENSNYLLPSLTLSVEANVNKHWYFYISGKLQFKNKEIEVIEVKNNLFYLPPFSIGFNYHFIHPKNYVSIKNKNNTILKNTLYFNLSNLGLGYERILFNYQNNNLIISLNPSLLPYKRFESSPKEGIHLMANLFVNYMYNISQKVSTEFGIGYSYQYTTFSIFDNNMFIEKSYRIKSNMGIRILTNRHLIFKINYSPTVYYKYNKFFEDIKRYRYARNTVFNVSIGYSFSK